MRASVPVLRRHLTAIVICAYFLIGVVLFWPDLQEFSHHLAGSGWDYAQTVWFLDWIPHALAHGLNPFASSALLVPTGVNLAQNTASPLLGLLIAPLGPLLNSVERANLLLMLAMPLSATAAFVVLRVWRVWAPAAALGGLVYGFSPYMVGQSRDHLELIFVPLPPFIVLAVVSIVQRRGSSIRLGVQLGLLVTAQYLISPEITAIVTVFAVAAVTIAAIRDRRQATELAPFVLRSAGIALVVAGLLLGYPVWMVIGGPQHFTGSTWPKINPYHNDLLSFVVPGPLQHVSLGMRQAGIHLDFWNGPTEAGGYIGIPTLLVVGLLIWRSRRSGRIQLAGVLLLGAAILSLGPYLAFNRSQTHFPLPFLLLYRLPLLNDILPSRLCFAEAACVAAVIAFGLDDAYRARAGRGEDARDSPRRDLRRLYVVFTCVALVVVVTLLPQERPRPASQPEPLPAAIRRAIPSGDPVTLTYPFPTQFTMQPMSWQTEDGFGFRLLGGYAYHPDAGGHPTLIPNVMRPSDLQQFLVGQDAETGYFYSGVYGPALRVTASRRVDSNCLVEISRPCRHRGCRCGGSRAGSAAVPRGAGESSGLRGEVLPLGHRMTFAPCRRAAGVHKWPPIVVVDDTTAA